MSGNPRGRGNSYIGRQYRPHNRQQWERQSPNSPYPSTSPALPSPPIHQHQSQHHSYERYQSDVRPQYTSANHERRTSIHRGRGGIYYRDDRREPRVDINNPRPELYSQERPHSSGTRGGYQRYIPYDREYDRPYKGSQRYDEQYKDRLSRRNSYESRRNASAPVSLRGEPSEPVVEKTLSEQLAEMSKMNERKSAFEGFVDTSSSVPVQRFHYGAGSTMTGEMGSKQLAQYILTPGLSVNARIIMGDNDTTYDSNHEAGRKLGVQDTKRAKVLTQIKNRQEQMDMILWKSKKRNATFFATRQDRLPRDDLKFSSEDTMCNIRDVPVYIEDNRSVQSSMDSLSAKETGEISSESGEIVESENRRTSNGYDEFRLKQKANDYYDVNQESRNRETIRDVNNMGNQLMPQTYILDKTITTNNNSSNSNNKKKNVFIPVAKQKTQVSDESSSDSDDGGFKLSNFARADDLANKTTPTFDAEFIEANKKMYSEPQSKTSKGKKNSSAGASNGAPSNKESDTPEKEDNNVVKPLFKNRHTLAAELISKNTLANRLESIKPAGDSGIAQKKEEENSARLIEYESDDEAHKDLLFDAQWKAVMLSGKRRSSNVTKPENKESIKMDNNSSYGSSSTTPIVISEAKIEEYADHLASQMGMLSDEGESSNNQSPIQETTRINENAPTNESSLIGDPDFDDDDFIDAALLSE